MAKEVILAGTEVDCGVYRCNACANEHECKEEGEKLPMCVICDSMSWRRSGKPPATQKGETSRSS